MNVEDVKVAFQAGYINFFTKLNQDRDFRKKFDSVTLGCQLAIFEEFIDEEYDKLKEEEEAELVNITVTLEDIKKGKLPTVTVSDCRGLKFLKEGLGKE